MREIGKKFQTKFQISIYGLIIHSKQIKKFISLYRSDKKFRSVHLTSFLNHLITNNFKIKCLPYNGKWFEFDDLKTYLILPVIKNIFQNNYKFLRIFVCLTYLKETSIFLILFLYLKSIFFI